MSEITSGKPSPEHIALFQQQGYLSLERVTTDAELDRLREIYDQVTRQRAGRRPVDFPPGNGSEEDSLVTIISPEGTAPELKESLLFQNARTLLADLLGVEIERMLFGWRIFFKPPRSGVTPWHQDAANRPLPHNGASLWMPLDDATTDSGCMYYIGGSHREGLRPHHFDDHHFMTEDVDPTAAVAAPVPAGGATFHHCLTLHSAGANTTDRPRRALVIVSQVRAAT